MKNQSTRGFDQVLRDLAKSIAKGEVAFLLGAGISKNSGLPLADSLKREILGSLRLESGLTSALANGKIPFEAFMESLAFLPNARQIIELYSRGEPNTNHLLIAHFAKRGYTNLIVTTNFDMLLERALGKHRLYEGQDFSTHFTESHSASAKPDWQKLTLVKLHGSAHSEQSVRTTLSLVAARALSTARQESVRRLFSSGSHKKVLVLGYSCSDEFDINPGIESIKASKKEVILVAHSPRGSTPQIQELRRGQAAPPFGSYRVTRIQCNTDSFVSQLCSLFGEPEYTTIKVVDWKSVIHAWADSVSVSAERYLSAAAMFSFAGDGEGQVNCLSKAITDAEAVHDPRQVIPLLAALHRAYQQMGGNREFKHALYEEFLKYARGSTEVAKHPSGIITVSVPTGEHDIIALGDFVIPVRHYDDKIDLVAQLSEYGRMMADEGDYENSIPLLIVAKEVLGESSKTSFRTALALSTCLLYLGDSYSQRAVKNGDESDIVQAAQCLDLSAKLSEAVGHLGGVVASRSDLGVLRILTSVPYTNDFDAGKVLLSDNLTLSLKVGNLEWQAHNCFWLGWAYFEEAKSMAIPEEKEYALRNIDWAIEDFRACLMLNQPRSRGDAEIKLKEAIKFKEEILSDVPKR